MKIKSIKSVKKIEGKKIMLRTDFNVAIKNGVIEEEYKIVRQIPTIKFLLSNKAKIILITHLGRPKNDNKKENSLEPIARLVSRLINKKVKLVNDITGFAAGTAVSRMKDGDVIMLDNIRLDPGEEKNSPVLGRNLAKLGDIYVNDAFAVSHRAHASVSAIKKFLPSYAGLLLEEELVNLNKALNPEKPLVLVIGGVKMETKVPLIKNFSKKASKILIGGALANNFLAAKKLNVGLSLTDKDSIALAKKFNFKNIILPVDSVVTNRNGQPVIKNVSRIESGDKILDIGPETIKLFASFIKQAKTIIWNGPLGFFEEEKYKHGTIAVGRVIAARSTGHAFGVVGGGETIAALHMTKMENYVDWVSTGGGAMLSYLGGEKMPGLSGLIIK